MSWTGQRAYTPRHAASPAAAAADRGSSPPGPEAPRHLAVLAAAVALLGISAYAMTADWPGHEGTFEGGAPVSPGLVPTATGPSAAPSTPASPTADPDVPSAGPVPTASRPVPSRTSAPEATGARPTRPAPGPTTRRPAGRDAVGGGPGRAPATPGAPRPTPRPTAAPAPAPSSPAPKPTSSPGQPPPTGAARCGAPENPYGYTYCGGALVQEPAPDVCRWFVCVPGFWAGRGYLIVCADGRIGMVGGPAGRCPERAGRKNPVYDDRPAAG